ncbi:MAG: DPP IV N-terminal domain-containing protein, partial [Phycisphaerales bacterium]|nr:DPP IV N-terminal domain-containing protein [Phycisphaerales bacterium]
MRTPSCTLSLFTLIILSACAVQPARPPAAAAMSKVQNLAFIEQYAATSAFRLGQPKALTSTPQGDAVLFLRSTGPTSFVQDLWLFDASTGEERVLLTAEQVLAGNAEVLTTEELARRERLRMSSRGIASFELADDGNRLLVPLSGRLFVIDITSRVLPKVRELKSDAGYPIDPRFTPDGQRVVCVRDNDLYVIDVDSGGETRLTTGGSETVSNGTAEFVAQEEMDRRRGFWLTPDHVVYQQTDTSKVEKFTIADAANPGKPAQSWRYPRAGRANADVRLGVMPLAGGPTAWLEWDHAAYPYLARVYCGEDSPLCILVQNREQTEQRLVRFDAPDRPVTLLTETDPAWINLSGAHWLKGTGEFLWTTEQGAAGAKDRARLELRAHDGTLLRTLIDGDADFAVAGVDWEGSCAVVTRAWDYSANQVWRYPVRGGEPRPLGELTPHAFHAPVLSKHSDLWVCNETYPDGRGAVVVGRGGLARGTARIIGEIRSVAAQPPFMPAPEFTTARVGGLDLNAAIIRP